MPEYATFHNTIFDRKCSKCKKTQENQYFVQNGRVYKTCNFCRDKAYRRRMDPEFLASVSAPGSTSVVARRVASIVVGPGGSAMSFSRHTPDSDTESEPSNNPVDSLIALGFDYTDIDNVLQMSSAAAASSSAGYFVIDNVLQMSSAAAASSSADYFVDEPEPEPEPDES